MRKVLISKKREGSYVKKHKNHFKDNFIKLNDFVSINIAATEIQ